MAGGLRQLSKVQYGWETSGSEGTPVAATEVWRGAASFIDDQRVIEYVEEHVGIIGGTDRQYIPRFLAQLALEETPATYEQLPFLFTLMFLSQRSGTADGTTSSGYTYTTTIPTTAAPTGGGRTATIETGDDKGADEMEYAHGLEISLTATGGEAMMVSATLQGRQATRTTLTGSLTLVDVEEILASRGKLYMDAIDGTIGSTQISSQLLGVDLTLTAIWVPKYTLDGNLYPQFFQYTAHEITGSLTFEHDNTDVVGADSFKEGWRAGTPYLMRLEWTGSDYETAGTGTTFSAKKGLRIDLPVKFSKANVIGEQDGNNTIVMDFTSKYNSTLGGSGSIVIANERATI